MLKILVQLYFEFFKAGLFAIGGGLATIPFLTDIGTRTGWFTPEELANMIAVSESTPGPMGVNMATYVGFTSAGILGSIVATVGLITPSIAIIVIIASILKKFRNNPFVESAFYGLRPASTGLIAAAGWSVICISLLKPDWAIQGKNILVNLNINWQACIVALVIFVCTRIKKLKSLHPIVWIALSAVAGIVLSL